MQNCPHQEPGLLLHHPALPLSEMRVQPKDVDADAVALEATDNHVAKRKRGPHLSKWLSDLKKGTQENVTFSGQVFHGLYCGVFLFAASVSFKNHPLNGCNFSTANQVLPFYGF